MARPPAPRPGTTTSPRLSVVALALLVLLATGSPERAGASERALQPIAVSQPWFGGAAPKVTAVDVTGEFLDRGTGRYHFRTKATVTRLGADRNGKITLLRASTWRDAFDQLDAIASAQLGLRRGFTRDSIVKTFAYTSAELRRPFPTLTANVSYEVVVSVEGREPRRSDPSPRRPKGGRSFVEPLSVGIPPGSHEVGVVGCFWPDETHPMTKPFAWFVRGLLGVGKLGTANKVRLALVAVASGGPAGPLAQLLATALAAQLGKSFLVTAVTCGASSSKVSFRTKMPNVVGQDSDDAVRELKARGVNVDVDVDVVRRASCEGFRVTVKRQSPAAGERLTPKQTVGIHVVHCLESAPTTGWTGDWTWKATSGTRVFTGPSPMTIAHQGQTVCAEWSFSGGGSAKGGFAGSKWTASWYDKFGKGSWTLTLQPDGQTFEGSQTIDPHGAGATYSATILGTRRRSASRRLSCSTIKVGP